MKVTSSKDKADSHRNYIILAIKEMKQVSSGKITKWVNDRVKSDLDERYDSIEYRFLDSKQNRRNKSIDLKRMQITHRGVQFILPKLKAEGLVSNNKYNEYTLTNAGQAVKIFAEPYGKSLFEALVKIPLKGTNEEKLLECVKRFGLYIAYIFLRNSSPTVVNSLYTAIEEDDVGYIHEATNLALMFEWFTDNFYSKHQKYSSRRENYFALMYALEKEFPEYIKNLITSETDYQKKVFPDYYKRIVLKKIENPK
jgi:hypothetical protein